MNTLANQPAVLLFPRHSLGQDVVNQIRQKAGKAVQKMAGGANVTSNILYRNFLASDLVGSTTGHLVNTATLSTTAFTQLYKLTVPQNTAFALFGIVLYNSAPGMDAIQINVGASPIVVAPLGEIRASGSGTTPQEGFFSEPVWVPPQAVLTVSALGSIAQTQSLELFNLIGYTAEPITTTVAKQAIAFDQNGNSVTA